MSHDAEGAIRVLQAGLEEEAIPRDAKEAKEATQQNSEGEVKVNVEAEVEAENGEAREVEKGEAKEEKVEKVEKKRFAQADTLVSLLIFYFFLSALSFAFVFSRSLFRLYLSRLSFRLVVWACGRFALTFRRNCVCPFTYHRYFTCLRYITYP